DMVRSTHYLEIIEEENLLENADKMGAYFLRGLEDIQKDEPLISAVRGRGLMLAFDLPDSETRGAFWKALYEHGILAITCGDRSIRFRPTLDIRTDEIDRVLEGVRNLCQKMGSMETTAN
ncbi:MAG TPA: aminotransferase class III-fold pyridoxal phosphate-dependent enzyme, partial [Opitutales bacterium]|nr:aminotransferase class III-fold pyridoxal phosphate-dependent enzyme [Opitutales bacterium]